MDVKRLLSRNCSLNFTCSVVVPGRTFLYRLANLTVGVRCPRYFHDRASRSNSPSPFPFERRPRRLYFRRLTREVKADLRLWLEFLQSYNGRSFPRFPLVLVSKTACLYRCFRHFRLWSSFWRTLILPVQSISTFGNVYGKWPESWVGKNIIVLEMLPIALSVSLWASELSNKCIIFHTDNQALIEVINKKTSKDKELLVLLRALILQCLHRSILFKATICLGCLTSKLMPCRDYSSRNSSPWVGAWHTNRLRFPTISYRRTGVSYKATLTS